MKQLNVTDDLGTDIVVKRNFGSGTSGDLNELLPLAENIKKAAKAAKKAAKAARKKGPRKAHIEEKPGIFESKVDVTGPKPIQVQLADKKPAVAPILSARPAPVILESPVLLSARLEPPTAAGASEKLPMTETTTETPAPASTSDKTPMTTPPADEPAAALEPRRLPPAARGPSAAQRRMNVKGMRPSQVVEAALFAAGKPLAVEEICDHTGLAKDIVTQALKDLQKDYETRDTALEVGKAGHKWGMQVRSVAAEPAARFAAMEIPEKVLKTLALIAFHQPMRQAELVDMLGTKVYEHVPFLEEKGLVRARHEGSTKILQVTAHFPEYFGLDASNADEIRMALGKAVGVTAPPKNQANLDLPADAPADVPIPDPAAVAPAPQPASEPTPNASAAPPGKRKRAPEPSLA